LKPRQIVEFDGDSTGAEPEIAIHNAMQYPGDRTKSANVVAKHTEESSGVGGSHGKLRDIQITFLEVWKWVKIQEEVGKVLDGKYLKFVGDSVDEWYNRSTKSCTVCLWVQWEELLETQSQIPQRIHAMEKKKDRRKPLCRHGRIANAGWDQELSMRRQRMIVQTLCRQRERSGV
jgi:hypothetical protein